MAHCYIGPVPLVVPALTLGLPLIFTTITVQTFQSAFDLINK